MRNFYFFLGLILSMGLQAQQWPVEQVEIDSLFLQKGLMMNLRTEALDEAFQVHPTQEGEVIFSYTSEDWENQALSSQEFIVLDHENRFRTVYMMEKLNPAAEIRQILGIRDVLNQGSAAIMGFAIWDIQGNNWVNPLLYLPLNRNLGELKVDHLLLVNEQGEIRVDTQAILEPGEYHLYGDIYMGDDPRLFPYVIELHLMGTLFSMISLDGLQYHEGVLIPVNGDIPLRKLFYEKSDYCYLGQVYISSGSMDLELILKDYQEQLLRRRFLLESSR